MESLTNLYAGEVAAGRLRADPAQEAALPELERIRAALTAKRGKRGFLSFGKKPEPVRGLYLWGGVGRGKSMLMDFFFDHVEIAEKRRVHFHAFMQEVHAALHHAREGQSDDPVKPVARQMARNLRLLCFDEMQIIDITDAMIVGRLFEHLFEAGVTVVTTSNRAPDDLYKDGLNRALFLPFIAMLKDRLAVHHLQSPVDYRKTQALGPDRYFSPPDNAARAAIDAIWDSVSEGRAAPLDIEIKGHILHLPLFHKGAARARFWDLCAQPYGAGDFLVLAERVDFLILEDVPLLHRENYNEAKRFVNLIDALYEAGAQVMISAAAPPDALYVEGEGVFEFERTASRLSEMQSADWGAGRV